MNKDSKTFVISLGGSMIVPGEINTQFLNEFRALLVSFIEKGIRFYIITGGGKICRMYNTAASLVGTPTTQDLDWMGIQATRVNAELVRILFKQYAPEKIVYSDGEASMFENFSVVVSGGWKPGGSSDQATVMLAKEVGAKHIVNLSNISFVYSADPKINPDAQKITDISWTDYRKIIPADWLPGLNTPFDPTASYMSEESNMEVAIMNGANLENLRKYLSGEPFDGTLIHN